MWIRIKNFIKFFFLRFRELFWQFYDEVLYELNNPSYPTGSVGASILSWKKWLKEKASKNPVWTVASTVFWPVRQLFRLRQISSLIFRKFCRYLFHTRVITLLMDFFEKYFFVMSYSGLLALALYFFVKPGVFDFRVLNHMFLLFFCVFYFMHRVYLLQDRSLPRLNILLSFFGFFVVILFFLFTFDLPAALFPFQSAKIPLSLTLYFLAPLLTLWMVCPVFFFYFYQLRGAIMTEFMDYTQRLLFFVNMVNLLLLFPWLIMRLVLGEVDYWIDLWTFYRLFGCLNGAFFFLLFAWSQAQENHFQSLVKEEALFYSTLSRDERRYLLVLKKNLWVFNQGIWILRIALYICVIILVYLIPYFLGWKPLSPVAYYYISFFMRCFICFMLFSFAQVYYVYVLVTRRMEAYTLAKTKKS